MRDSVSTMNGGAFNGGEAGDRLTGLGGGTFNGSRGGDIVFGIFDGTFNGGTGGPGCDFAREFRAGRASSRVRLI
jgi:hypothetical protein